MALGSIYLNDFAQRERQPALAAAKPARFALHMSDGPMDSWEHLDLKFDPSLTTFSRAGGGDVACRELVAQQHGVSTVDVVLINGGTSLVNHHVINAMLHGGGLVFTEFPIYDPLEAACRTSHADNAKEIGTNPAYRLLRRAPDFQICEQEFRRVLAQRPRLIVVANPHNPTGIAVRNLPQLLALVDADNAGRADRDCTFVLVDEVYRQTHVGAPIPCAATLSQYAISAFSLTKAFGLSGVRFGAALSRSAHAIDCVLAYHSAAQSSNPALLEDLWTQIYRKRPALLASILARQQRMIAFIRKLFDEHKVAYYPPDGGSVVTVKLPPHCADEHAFLAALKDQCDVQGTPGSFFTMPGHVRLAYLRLPEPAVREGFTRFARFYRDQAARAAHL